jgi:hypothetical protein
VGSAAFVDEGGIACDDEEPSELGKSSDDVFADAVRKIFLSRIAGHVCERKHGDCGTVWERQSRARLLADFLRGPNDRMRQIAGIWQRANGTDETQALARDCADEFLLRAAVPDRPSGSVDAAAQCGIGNDSAAPNRSNELVFTDDAITVLYQVNQKVKNLWLHGKSIGSVAQFTPIGIKCMIREAILHL